MNAFGLLVAVALFVAPAQLTDGAVHTPPNYYTFTPPPVHGSYVDPVFGMPVTRGTDALGMGREFLSAEYTSSDLVNADETLVRIVNNNGAQEIYSLPDFQRLRVLNGVSSSQSDWWWDVNDPKRLYAAPANRIDAYDVTTGVSAPVHTFSATTDGMGESNLSLDGNRLALKVGSDLVVYQFSTDSIVAQAPTSAISPFFDASIAADGQHVVVHGAGSRSYAITGGGYSLIGQLGPGGGHSDQAMGPDGRPYMFYVDSLNTNSIYRCDVIAASCTNLHTFGWTAGVGFGIYISANSTHNDGWIYVSSELGTNMDPDPSVAWVPYVAEILRMRWDTGDIERLAHTRTLPLSYYASTRASVSRSGDYVFWSSNYRKNHVPNAKDNYADVYFIDLGAPVPPPPVQQGTPVPWESRTDPNDPTLIEIVHIESTAPVTRRMLWDARQADAETVAAQNQGCTAEADPTSTTGTWQVMCTTPGAQTITVVGRTDDPAFAATVVADNQ